MAGEILFRRGSFGQPIPWTQEKDVASSSGLADPVVDAGTRALLAEILECIQQMSAEPDFSVPALAGELIEILHGHLAVEVRNTVTTEVANLPATFPLPAEQVELLIAKASDTGLTVSQLHERPLHVTGPLTELELRQAPLTVQGPLTDEQVRAKPLEVTLVGRDGQPMRFPSAPSGGGGGGGLSIANERAILDIKRGLSDFETRLDYDGRSDEQPVYLGRAPAGHDPAAQSWLIEKVTYDGDDRPVRKQIKNGAWDDRAALTW